MDWDTESTGGTSMVGSVGSGSRSHHEGFPRGRCRWLNRSTRCSERSSNYDTASEGSAGKFGSGVGRGSTKGERRRSKETKNRSLYRQNSETGTTNLDDYAYTMTCENIGFGTLKGQSPVTLPRFLTKKHVINQTRWILNDSGPVQLPLNTVITAILLAVDKKDVMYFRNVEPEEYIEIDRTSWKFMHKDLQSSYAEVKNQAKYCIGQAEDKWVPILGEVVVVRVGRVEETNFPLREPDHFNEATPCYERAVVIGLDPYNGVKVDLLDDYGSGWVKPVECYKIFDKFTYLDAQKYACEMSALGLVQPKHVLGAALKRFPIKGIYSNRNLNHMDIKWTGDVAPSGNPLVTVNVNMKMNRSLDLRMHVFRQLPKLLDPISTLSMDECSIARVLDISKFGFMHLRLKSHDSLFMSIRESLESLANVSTDLALKPKFFKTPPRTGKASDIYIIKLSGVEGERDPNENVFYRVTIEKITGASGTTWDKVLVKCLDHLVMREVSMDELIPLGRIYPDLKYIPPLVCRVHLHTIMKITGDLDVVKSYLTNRIVKIRLVRAYPLSVCPPEVIISLFSDPGNFQDPAADSVAPWLIKKRWAEETDSKRMKCYEHFVNQRVAELRYEEELKRTEGYHRIYMCDKPDRGFEKYLKQHMFTGELIEFQRPVMNRLSRATSMHSFKSVINIDGLPR